MPSLHGVARMDLGEGLGDMGGEPGAFAGARHRVPLVADAAGVEREREVGAGAVGDRQR